MKKTAIIFYLFIFLTIFTGIDRCHNHSDFFAHEDCPACQLLDCANHVLNTTPVFLLKSFCFIIGIIGLTVKNRKEDKDSFLLFFLRSPPIKA